MSSPQRAAPVAVLAALLAAASLAPAPAAAQDAPFEPTGELRFSGGGFGNGASFDSERIVGPLVNLTRRDDGSWAGDLGGLNLDLQPAPGGLHAPNVTLKFSSKNGKTKIEGLIYGERIRIEIDRKKLTGRFGGCSMTLVRKGPPVYRGDIGCLQAGERLPRTAQVSFEVIGEAAAEEPPLPQFVLALLAVLPS